MSRPLTANMSLSWSARRVRSSPAAAGAVGAARAAAGALEGPVVALVAAAAIITAEALLAFDSFAFSRSFALTSATLVRLPAVPTAERRRAGPELLGGPALAGGGGGGGAVPSAALAAAVPELLLRPSDDFPGGDDMVYTYMWKVGVSERMPFGWCTPPWKSFENENVLPKGQSVLCSYRVVPTALLLRILVFVR